jgi:hypothetical protein
MEKGSCGRYTKTSCVTYFGCGWKNSRDIGHVGIYEAHEVPTRTNSHRKQARLGGTNLITECGFFSYFLFFLSPFLLQLKQMITHGSTTTISFRLF